MSDLTEKLGEWLTGADDPRLGLRVVAPLLEQAHRLEAEERVLHDRAQQLNLDRLENMAARFKALQQLEEREAAHAVRLADHLRDVDRLARERAVLETLADHAVTSTLPKAFADRQALDPFARNLPTRESTHAPN